MPYAQIQLVNSRLQCTERITVQMSKHQFFENYVKFPVQRGQDLNAAMKLLSFEFHGKPQETKKVSLDAFVQISEKSRSKLEVAARRAYAALDDLTNVFLPRDRLLASSGLLPVYYWFIHGLAAKQYSLARDFLIRFEQARRENRQKAEQGSRTGVDRLLLEYDQLNRNTNDLISHNRRIEILHERFRRYEASLLI